MGTEPGKTKFRPAMLMGDQEGDVMLERNLSGFIELKPAPGAAAAGGAPPSIGALVLVALESPGEPPEVPFSAIAELLAR